MIPTLHARLCHGGAGRDRRLTGRPCVDRSTSMVSNRCCIWSAPGNCRLVLGQVATDEKSNEITAVPKLLEMLSLTSTIVTADAMNCQRAIAAQVVAQGGDYVPALKGNQGTLHADVRLYIDDLAHTSALTTSRAVDGDHGRIENRDAFVCTTIDWLQERHSVAWPGRHR
jgi:hypothetical protein